MKIWSSNIMKVFGGVNPYPCVCTLTYIYVKRNNTSKFK